jgi:hypothetical protein
MSVFGGRPDWAVTTSGFDPNRTSNSTAGSTRPSNFQYGLVCCHFCRACNDARSDQIRACPCLAFDQKTNPRPALSHGGPNGTGGSADVLQASPASTAPIKKGHCRRVRAGVSGGPPPKTPVKSVVPAGLAAPLFPETGRTTASTPADLAAAAPAGRSERMAAAPAMAVAPPVATLHLDNVRGYHGGSN